MTEAQWYSPHSVTAYTKAQVKWLVPLLPMLRNGEYPPKPSDSGFFDQAGYSQHHSKPWGKFELPAGIAAELDKRITKCGYL